MLFFCLIKSLNQFQFLLKKHQYRQSFSMADVTFICKRTVVSTRAVEPGKFVPLSVLDRIMERNHLRIVFYYQFPNNAVRKAGELTNKLRESISEMLSYFPVVVGRLVRSPDKGQWMIKCNDAGLRMVEAKVKCSVGEWLKNVGRSKELKLVHWEDMYQKSYFWSPFCVQITEFEDGGVAIGLSCTHLLSDPICATMIIKAWADMTLAGKINGQASFQPLPHSISDNQPHIPLINHYRSVLENVVSTSNNTKQTTISLKFSQEMVEKCISLIGGHDHELRRLTPFESLASLFWTCISKIKGAKDELVDMSICIDMRKELVLDKGFFGNCMVYNRVKGNGVNDDDVSKAAIAIKNAVSEMDSDGVLDLVEWLEKEKFEMNPPRMNGFDLVCVNLENVDPYSAVFEDNAGPICVSYYIEPAIGLGQVLILPGPKGEGAFGRVVMVTIQEDEAEKLLDDVFIQQFAPTILMGLSKTG